MSIRVERHGDHEWNVFVTEPSEWGPSERLYCTVDDCDTEAQALAAARRLLESRGSE